MAYMTTGLGFHNRNNGRDTFACEGGAAADYQPPAGDTVNYFHLRLMSNTATSADVCRMQNLHCIPVHGITIRHV
jgi:hypothetical protein